MTKSLFHFYFCFLSIISRTDTFNPGDHSVTKLLGLRHDNPNPTLDQDDNQQQGSISNNLVVVDNTVTDNLDNLTTSTAKAETTLPDDLVQLGYLLDDTDRMVRSYSDNPLLTQYINANNSLLTAFLNSSNLPKDFFSLPPNISKNADIVDYTMYKTLLGQLQRRHEINPNVMDSPNSDIQPANSSYTLHRLGTLLGSIGYAHVSFIINITEIYESLDGVCGCSAGLGQIVTDNSTKSLEVLLRQHHLVLKAGCQQIRERLDHIKTTFLATETNIPSAHRQKRQLIVGAAVLLASLSGLFTATTLYKVASEAFKTQQNQDFVIEMLAREELKLNRTMTEILITERTLSLLELHLRG